MGHDLDRDDDRSRLDRGRFIAQSSWLIFLKTCGRIHSDKSEMADFYEYGRLFEKLFERGDFLLDDGIVVDVLNKVFLRFQSLSRGQRFYLNHVQACLISYLIDCGVIKDKEEFLNGPLGVIFKISVGEDLEGLRKFERPDLRGSVAVDFIAGADVIVSTKAQVERQIVQ